MTDAGNLAPMESVADREPKAGALHQLAWLFLGGVASTAVALTSMTGGLSLAALADHPFYYRVDAVWHEVVIRQLLQGQPFAGNRFGYPFGANWNDWPSLDWGILGVAKLLGVFTGDYVLVTNLLFLLGFPLAFTSAFLVARRFGLTSPFAFVAGAAFALSSYHFNRLLLQGHLFLTWYFTAPIYILIAWQLVHPAAPNTRARATLRFAGLTLLTAFNIYYVAFGLIAVAAAMLQTLSRDEPRAVLRRAFPFFAAQLLGIALQFSPTILFKLQNGQNPIALSRDLIDSDLLGFRPIQLLLPHALHRVPSLADAAIRWQLLPDAANETALSSIGAIASIGLVILLMLTLHALCGGLIDQRARLLAMLTLVFVAFGTKGGAGLAFASSGFTFIRSWNRLSIFIEFAAILATLLALEPSFMRFSRRLRRRGTPWLITAAVLFIAVDQTPSYDPAFAARQASRFQVERGFVQQLERDLPRGSAIYQLPFVGFPAESTVPHYDSYEFMKPFLESESLRFNLGSMQGRPGDVFYRSLAQRPLPVQLAAIRRLGFSGLYIDRIGFSDGGSRVLRQLDLLVGPESATWRSDRRVVYYSLTGEAPALATTPLPAASVYALAEYAPAFPKRHRGD